MIRSLTFMLPVYGPQIYRALTTYLNIARLR